jgi:hypothetical protein
LKEGTLPRDRIDCRFSPTYRQSQVDDPPHKKQVAEPTTKLGRAKTYFIAANRNKLNRPIIAQGSPKVNQYLPPGDAKNTEYISASIVS